MIRIVKYQMVDIKMHPNMQGLIAPYESPYMVCISLTSTVVDKMGNDKLIYKKGRQGNAGILKIRGKKSSIYLCATPSNQSNRTLSEAKSEIKNRVNTHMFTIKQNSEK
jgi:hypothetical protein